MPKNRFRHLALLGLSLLCLEPIDLWAGAREFRPPVPAAISRSVTPLASESPVAREVRHVLLLLPDYTVFDHLTFQVEGNVVRLSGQVTRPSLKSEAEEAVKQIQGVERVESTIEVLPVSTLDSQIRIAAYRSIYGHPALARYAAQAVPPIHLIVNNGRLTLEGVVASPADKAIAKTQALIVPGVFSVIDHLQVES